MQLQPCMPVKSAACRQRCCTLAGKGSGYRDCSLGRAVLPWFSVDCAALAGLPLGQGNTATPQVAAGKPNTVGAVCFGQGAQARLLRLGQSTHSVQARRAVQHAPGRTGCCGGGRRHLWRVSLCQVKGQTQHSQGTRDTGQAGQQEPPAAARQLCSAVNWGSTLQGQLTCAACRGVGHCWVTCIVMPAAVSVMIASHVLLSTAALGRQAQLMQEDVPARPAQQSPAR